MCVRWRVCVISSTHRQRARVRVRIDRARVCVCLSVVVCGRVSFHLCNSEAAHRASLKGMKTLLFIKINGCCAPPRLYLRKRCYRRPCTLLHPGGGRRSSHTSSYTLFIKTSVSLFLAYKLASLKSVFSNPLLFIITLPNRMHLHYLCSFYFLSAYLLSFSRGAFKALRARTRPLNTFSYFKWASLRRHLVAFYVHVYPTK